MPSTKCRDIRSFELLSVAGEGTYGKVYMAVDTELLARQGGVVSAAALSAVKRVKTDVEQREGVGVTALREIQLLKSLDSCPNVVRLRDVAVGGGGGGGGGAEELYLVFEYAENDLAALVDVHRVVFKESEAKSIAKQLLEGVRAMHAHHIMHRDLKPSNILYTNDGVVKICDFGLARLFSTAPAAGGEPERHTPCVVTLWYRAPEVLLGARGYGSAIDLWSVGCVVAELLLGAPLAGGGTPLEQLQGYFDALGYPGDADYAAMAAEARGGADPRGAPGLLRAASQQPAKSLSDRMRGSESAAAFVRALLRYNPAARPTAEAALTHAYFSTMPYAADPALMPRFSPAKSSLPAHTRSYRQRGGAGGGGGGSGQHSRSEFLKGVERELAKRGFARPTTAEGGLRRRGGGGSGGGDAVSEATPAAVAAASAVGAGVGAGAVKRAAAPALCCSAADDDDDDVYDPSLLLSGAGVAARTNRSHKSKKRARMAAA